MENNDLKELDFVWIENDQDKEKLKDEGSKHPGAIIFYCGDNEHDLYVGSTKLTDVFNTGDVPDNVPTRTIGGLGASTIGELKKKSISDILLAILRE